MKLRFCASRGVATLRGGTLLIKCNVNLFMCVVEVVIGYIVHLLVE